MRPTVSAAVIVSRSRVPKRSRARRKGRWSTTRCSSRATVRRCAFLDGQPRPAQVRTMRAPLGAPCTTSASRRACVRVTAHWLVTTAPSCANGSARRSQFSSNGLPRISSAVGLIAALASSQSPGCGKPSPSRSRLGLSRPSQFSSMPLSNTSGFAGGDVRGAVVAVDVRAEAVAVAVDPALALGDDVGEVVVAPRRCRRRRRSAPPSRRAPGSCRRRSRRSSRRRPSCPGACRRLSRRRGRRSPRWSRCRRSRSRRRR